MRGTLFKGWGAPGARGGGDALQGAGRGLEDMWCKGLGDTRCKGKGPCFSCPSQLKGWLLWPLECPQAMSDGDGTPPLPGQPAVPLPHVQKPPRAVPGEHPILQGAIS